ncbi:MAG: tetratricopeptide repeat protein [Bacteroidota bacterium]
MRKNLLAVLFLFTLSQAFSQNEEALVIGDRLYALGNYTQAIIEYNKVGTAHTKMARCYEALGDHVKAIQYYKLSLLEHPDATIAKYNYGKLLLKTAQYDRADSLFTALEMQYPENPNFPYHLGLIKERQRDSTARTYFERVVAMDSTHQNALYKLSRSLVEKRQFETAKQWVSSGLRADPNSIRFLTLRALINFYNKNYHEALSTYKKLLKLKQSNAQLHENLAVCFRNTNQFEKALEQYTILINEYDDQTSEWHYGIGVTYMSLKDYEKARRHIEIAILLKDLSIEDEQMTLSYLFSATKDYRSQMEVLNKVVNNYPQNERAMYYLAAAADNYFEDRTTVIPFYERYLKKFGESGRFREFAKQRIKDLKTELHFKKD